MLNTITTITTTTDVQQQHYLLSTTQQTKLVTSWLNVIFHIAALGADIFSKLLTS